MINGIPVLGWILSVVISMSMSLPFWFFWTVCGIGKKYFYFIPVLYQSISFWNCVALFICISILKSILIPSLSSVTNTNNK